MIWVLAMVVTQLLPGQDLITLQGQLLDKDNGQTIPFGTLKINDTYAFADESGFFSTEVTKAESYQIEIDQIGYQLETIQLTAPTPFLRLNLTPKAIILQEVLVTNQHRYSIPQSDTHIDEARQFTQAKDVGNLFREIPGFGIIKRGGIALDPVFRSFKYEQLNLFYDGGLVTTYACPGRMDPATTHVNPQDVEKIELIKGPFSMRYGPTMGAIINVVTESKTSPEFSGIGGSVEGSYETNGNGKMTKLALFGAEKKYDFVVSGGLKDYDSYRSGNGTVIPTAFRAYDYHIAGGFNPNDNQRLAVNWRQGFMRDVLHAGLPMDTDLDNSFTLSTDYSWKNISPRLYGLTVKAYGSHVDHVMSNKRRPNFSMVDAEAIVQANTFGGRAELAWMPNQKILVHSGLDHRYVSRDGERVRLIKRNRMTGEALPSPKRMVDPIWQNARILNTGVFSEGRFFVHPSWTLLLGARLDYNLGEIRDPDPGFQELYSTLDPRQELNWSATASITHQLRKDWMLQLALGRGVRNPNMIERYINHFTVGMDPYEYVGNPNLRPEVNNQVEVSIQKQGDRFRVGVNTFYSYFQDYITARVDSTLPSKMTQNLPFARRFVNIDRAFQTGIELTGQVEIVSHFTTYGSLSYTYAQNLSWQEPIAEIPPMEAILGARYERSIWWTDLRARFVAMQDRVALSFDESTTPGFATLDFRAGVQPLPDLSVGASVLNMLDQQYREHLNRVYRNAPEQGVIFEPGINVAFFVRYEFGGKGGGR